MAEKLCQRWLITGRVQGVGYRAWMMTEAQQLSLDGWVRNLSCGQVEAAILGDPESLAQLHRACLRGPAAARVSRIELLPAEPGTVLCGTGFRQIRGGA